MNTLVLMLVDSPIHNNSLYESLVKGRSVTKVDLSDMDMSQKEELSEMNDYLDHEIDGDDCRVIVWIGSLSKDSYNSEMAEYLSDRYSVYTTLSSL